MTFVEDYQNLLIKQYSDKTNALAEIALKAGVYERVFDLFGDFITDFDLDFATGDRLDIISNIVGVSRVVPSILTKIYFGFSDNSNVTGFDDKYEEGGDLGPLFDKFGTLYNDYTLDDSDLKDFIQAKIYKNIAKNVMISTSSTSIQSAINSLFEGLGYVVDNFDMTLTLYVDSSIDDTRLKIINQLNLLPKPMGVRYILKQANPTNTFGFSNNLNSKGFLDRFNPTVEAGGAFLNRIF